MAKLSKEQQWYKVLRQAYNARPCSWMRDIIVQHFIYSFCLTGYDHTVSEDESPPMHHKKLTSICRSCHLERVERMIATWDDQFRDDPAHQGPPFQMPSLTVVGRQEPVPGGQQPSGITTATNPYGDAIKNVFEFCPAEQTDDEKEALAIAGMDVLQHLHTIELSKVDSTVAKNDGGDLDDAGYSDNEGEEAEPGNEQEFLAEFDDDIGSRDEANQGGSPTSEYRRTLAYNDLDASLRR